MDAYKQEKQSPGPENEQLMTQQPPDYTQQQGYPPPQQYGSPQQHYGPPPQQSGPPPHQCGPPPQQYGQAPGAYPPGQPSVAYTPGTVYVDGKGQPVQPSYGHNIVVTQPVIATGPVVVQRPQNWMIPSILACLCCFCPTGIFAIYYANQANTYVDEMNMTEAERANRTARNLVIASVVIGVCWIILVIILRLVVFTTQYAIVYS